ncbi:ATP-grasp domain-containing protein [Hymenobacter coccineus]|uniref:ATP-grasp domain-containing protein n=1 Tax=Hymenobacter coccineus TaxID=1908235 RepID=UPI0009F1CB79|nr:glutathione synthase [Hymenobacter coccineus]
MKKIGILFGQENTFPQAFVDRVNQKAVDGITAEFVKIDHVEQAVPTDYAVIIDRISQDVPFYRAYLKNAALTGTDVINNPFWWSADEKFFNNALAVQLGVPVPKTLLLPSKHRPDDTSENSFRNLNLFDWEKAFEKIGFPAFMKPHSGGGWKSVYKVDNPYEALSAYEETGQLVMLYQEAVDFTDYFRCYCLGGKDVLIMPYEPRNEFHQRYQTEMKTQGEAGEKLLATVKDYTLRLCQGLGYDFNTVEFAVRDGIPIAIDFGNPAPDADINSVGPENFEWVVEHAANLAIARAQAQQPGTTNLTWGTFVQKSASQVAAPSAAGKAKVGASVHETNDLGATGAPAAPKKAAAPKKSGAPKPEAPTGSVPKPAPKPKSAPKAAPAGGAPAKPKKPAPKK